MPDKAKKTQAAADAPEETPVENTVVESVYTVDEFTGAAGTLFGCSPDLVRAALRLAGKTEYTRNDALGIVKEFCERKVN